MLLFICGHSFSPSAKGRKESFLCSEMIPHQSLSERRRSLLLSPIQLVFLNTLQKPKVANAVTSQTMSTEEAESKYREGYKTINYLLDHYDEICEGGGDNVRRYLGTIVSNPPSALVGIKKAMKALEYRADDFIEFTETADEVMKTIDQASGSAYMAIFVTTSTSYTPPQKYFDDGKIEIKRCKKTMEDLATMVDIKL